MATGKIPPELMKVKNPSILLVEDDENDQHLIQHAFKSVGIRTPIHIARHGGEAIAYLNGEGKYSDRKRYPFPTTIITDLKMPVMDGFSVLLHRKHQAHWSIIPVIVLSASADPDDIKKAYLLGASAYHVKPNTTDELRRQLKLLHDYWATSETPETDPSGAQLHTESAGKLGERFS